MHVEDTVSSNPWPPLYASQAGRHCATMKLSASPHFLGDTFFPPHTFFVPPPPLPSLLSHPPLRPPPAGTQVLGKDAERAMGGVPTVKGFATIDHVCLINIEGTGMVGVPGG